MLFLQPYRPLETPHAEEYCAQLHELNENLSLLLRLRANYFKECWEGDQFPNCQRSWLLCILSILSHLPHQGKQAGQLGEEWQEEYATLLEAELWGRALKLAGRILEVGAAPLLRAVDLVFVLRTIKGAFQTPHLDRELLFRFVLLLLRTGIVLRKALVRFVQSLPPRSSSSGGGETDFAAWCFLLAAAQLEAGSLEEVAIADCLIRVQSLQDLSLAGECLKYLSRLPLWGHFDAEGVPLITKVAREIITGLSDVTLLVDLLASTGSSALNRLAQELREESRKAQQLGVLMEALPSLSLKDAKEGLAQCHGDASLAISKLDKSKDLTRALLDDKRFVRENMEKILLASEGEDEDGPSHGLYEDEYVDTYDQTSSAPPPASARGAPDRDIRSHRVLRVHSHRAVSHQTCSSIIER